MMKRLLFLFVLATPGMLIYAQVPQATSVTENEFRGSAMKVNDLVHTKLDVKFDYAKS